MQIDENTAVIAHRMNARIVRRDSVSVTTPDSLGKEETHRQSHGVTVVKYVPPPDPKPPEGLPKRLPLEVLPPPPNGDDVEPKPR